MPPKEACFGYNGKIAVPGSNRQCSTSGMLNIACRNDPDFATFITMKSGGDPVVLITIVTMLALLLTAFTLSLFVYFRNHTLFSTMSEHALEWLADKAIGWSHTPPMNKIDTHHHCVPSFYAKAVEKQGGDPSGWPTPHWSPLASKLLMKRVGVQTAVLSVTAPGACILPDRQARAQLARQLNEYSADLRNKEPERFSLFVSLPNILDTEDALAEIAYGLDTLNADGVTLFTRYGSSNTYLGHPDVEPIWAELNKRKCVVFIHPTHPVDTNPVNTKLPQPSIDYPHETIRTALDMITNGTRLKYPDCKVILSHAGGALPYIISRVTTPMKKAPDFAVSHRIGTTHGKAMEAFRSFHYDLALSSSPQVLDMLLKLVPHEHILYGSDFPYAPITAYPAFLEELENYQMDPELRNMINFGNALKLFPRLASRRGGSL